MIDASCRDLVHRLNIPYKDWNKEEPTFIEARGVFSTSHEEIKRKAFPTLNHGKFENMTSSEMLEFAFKKEHVRGARLFATMDSYMSHFLTPEGAKFLAALPGLRDDYTLPFNPESYIQYLELQSANSVPEHVRPLLGMSMVIEGLAGSFRRHGGRLYSGNKVLSINTDEIHTFRLETQKLVVTAKKLVIAVPPGPFQNVKGILAQQIQQQAIFRSFQPMPVFKGAAVFQNAWWETLVGGFGSLKPLQQFVSNSDCLEETLPYE